MTDDRQWIDDFLHYGYDPGCATAGLPDPIVDATREEPFDMGDDALIELVQSAFRRAIAAGVDGDETHHVLLSAGLDSRAILAALLDRPDVQPADVRTVTFGTPGTWDFEIGKRVADAAGVRNRAIDLRPEAFDWSLESLRAYAREQSFPIRMLEGYVNDRATDVGDADITWSGFLGGTTTGQHVRESPLQWEQALAEFVDSGRYSTLARDDYEPKRSLPAEPYLPGSVLPYRNQLSFAHRQQCYIRPVVCPDESTRTPFAHPEWLRVVLNVPRSRRSHRRLFVEAMSDAYPELFALPTDANAGFSTRVGTHRRKLRRARLRLTDRVTSRLGVNYVHPDTNYVDFDAAFRTPGDLRDAAENLLSTLDDRSILDWIDPLAVWEDHQTGTDRGKDLKVLCSLELYLNESRTDDGIRLTTR